MAKGRKTGGRKAGTPNKAATVREVLALCFEGIGGLAAFQEWAQANRGDFYTKLWGKQLTVEAPQVGDSAAPLVIEVTQRASASHPE